MASTLASRRSGITGIDFESEKFLADLKHHLAIMEVETEDDLLRVGFSVQAHARKLCPVDTGRLRSSIIVTKGHDGTGYFVEVGTNVEYAAFVEFGTSNMRAQPFLVPAVALASGFLRTEASA